MTKHLSISKLAHVTVQVNDLEQAREFYEQILGWVASDIDENIAQKGIVWYELPDGRQIHLFQTAAELPINRAHFALNVEDVSGWQAYLIKAGLEIIAPSVEVKGTKRFFVRDPSGNLIEFVKWL